MNAGVPEPQVWLETLARIPLLHQPGEAWLYNTCSDLQGVLVARASGRPLPEFLAERIFEPLGMTDTGFVVPAEKHAFRDGVPADRRRRSRARRPAGRRVGLDAGVPVGCRRPGLDGGRLAGVRPDAARPRRRSAAGGRRVLSEEAVRSMTTDHLTADQRADSRLFLEGQGWGFGGSVDVARENPWNVPGRYGWVGGTGTAAHVVPSTGTVTILLTQREMTGPETTPHLRAFWRHAAG